MSQGHFDPYPIENLSSVAQPNSFPKVSSLSKSWMRLAGHQISEKHALRNNTGIFAAQVPVTDRINLTFTDHGASWRNIKKNSICLSNPIYSKSEQYKAQVVENGIVFLKKNDDTGKYHKYSSVTPPGKTASTRLDCTKEVVLDLDGGFCFKKIEESSCIWTAKVDVLNAELTHVMQTRHTSLPASFGLVMEDTGTFTLRYYYVGVETAEFLDTDKIASILHVVPTLQQPALWSSASLNNITIDEPDF